MNKYFMVEEAMVKLIIILINYRFFNYGKIIIC
jgi:hypothetical protein